MLCTTAPQSVSKNITWTSVEIRGASEFIVLTGLKSETMESKRRQFENGENATSPLASDFHLSEFVSDFDIRISDFPP